jgi:hypothetical protein
MPNGLAPTKMHPVHSRLGVPSMVTAAGRCTGLWSVPIYSASGSEWLGDVVGDGDGYGDGDGDDTDAGAQIARSLRNGDRSSEIQAPVVRGAVG